MLLAIDVGNTQTHIGMYDGENLAEHWRPWRALAATHLWAADAAAQALGANGHTQAWTHRQPSGKRAYVSA